jgi:hypothetical protein
VAKNGGRRNEEDDFLMVVRVRELIMTPIILLSAVLNVHNLIHCQSYALNQSRGILMGVLNRAFVAGDIYQRRDVSLSSTGSAVC